MKSNLHLHSRFSDGSLWPEEIARRAAEMGLEMVALTDHDTMGGCGRFAEECARLGLAAVTACEIDVSDPTIGYKSEILGYFPGKSADQCAKTMGRLGITLNERRKRLEYYLYWARTYFRRDGLTFEEMLRDKLGENPSSARIPDGISWSRVDLFLFLKAKGLVPSDLSYKKFKKEWFVSGRFPVYKLPKPDAAATIRLIHADGGFAVIPHFGHLWNDEAAAMERDESKVAGLLEYFRSRGADGVELYWYSGRKKSEEINSFVARIAEPMGFFLTYGSDCHGPGTDKYTMDRFSGEMAGFPPVSRGS